MKCKICDGISIKKYEEKVLNKYKVDFYQCKECGFLFAENPFWLNEAYKNPILKTDIGLLKRNLYNRKIVTKVIKALKIENDVFLDYGGGYGILTRLMRDLGYKMYGYDLYAENIFANLFNVDRLKGYFKLVTAFEMLEHVENPLEEIKKMLTVGESILFSTELMEKEYENMKEWWYFNLDEGQHISFYTECSIEALANEVGCNYYRSGSFHLFTKSKLRKKVLKIRLYEKVLSKIYEKIILNSKESLLLKDYNEMRRNGNVKRNEVLD